MRAQLPPSSTLILTTLLTVVPGKALAQVIPDNTLGAESSLIIPAISTEGSSLTRIEGGAIRGSNLFHSFLEFNIDAGQQLYFANPDGIATILSRVTGSSPSQIFGTLGVEGSANLFLLNPNGIVFGPEASLDIAGSFYATTAGAIPLGNGVFSAVEPEQSSLLSVSPSALFTAYLTPNSGDIQSQGALAAEGDLTLAANNLDLEGQLAAGGDLTLLADSTVQIRDSAEDSFVALAGGNLLAQGNEQVDIVTLSHPDSGLYAYGDITLRSASAVGGDAYYWSGGTFRVEALDGSVGSLYSPVDPIIRTIGDVFIENYIGSSLHILAGGAVTIGTVTIFALEAGQVRVDFLQESIQLSNGSLIEINGGRQPTLDVRAGVSPEAIGTPPIEILTGFNSPPDFLSNASVSRPPLSADITVGDVGITAPNGLVLLTTQYEPNTDISGGSIAVTGEGFYSNGINARGFDDQGSAVFLDAREDITITNSFISTTGPGEVGDIVLIAGDTVRFDSLNGSPTGVSSSIAKGGIGTGGDVQIWAANLEVLNGSQLIASTFGEGDSGSVLLEITDTARFEGVNLINGRRSGAFSSVQPGGEGTGGNVEIQAGTLEVLNGAELSVSTFGEGDSGSVLLEVTDTARFVGFNPISGNPSGAFSGAARGGKGTGGNVELQAANLEVLNGAALSASTFGEGDSGSVLLEITDTARFEGFNPINGSQSGAFSSVQPGGKGTGGNVELRATTLEVLNGAALGAGTFGEGAGGSVLLEVTDTARFVGFNPISGNPSSASSSVGPDGKGTGGNVELRATTLKVLNGAQLISSTFGEGDSGSVLLEVTDTARFEGFNSTNGNSSGALSNVQPGGKGTGGNVELRATTLEVLNGAQLISSTVGQGDSGSVLLKVAGTARFEGFNSNNGNQSGAFSGVAPSGMGNGNDIRIQAERLDIRAGALLFAGSLGQGDAGNIVLNIRDLIQLTDGDIATNAVTNSGGQIQIQAGSILLLGDSDIRTFVQSGENSGGDITVSANFLIALDDSDILAFAVDGRGGNIDFTRTAFFGQNFQIAASSTDPSGLDGNSRVDISATGGLVSGTIVLPDVSFIENSLNELAETAISPETLTAGSCIARSKADGSFVVSGSDGLPSRPGEVGSAPFATGSVQPFDGTSFQSSEVEHVSVPQEPEGLYQLEDGRLVLSRACQN